MSSQRALVQVRCARKWPVGEYQVFGDRKTKCLELVGIRRCERNSLPGFRAKGRESLETLVCEKMFEEIRKRNAWNCLELLGQKRCSKTSEHEMPGTAGGKKNAAKHPNTKCRELPGTAGAEKKCSKASAREMPGTAGAEKNASTKCREWLGNARECQKA